MNTMNTAIKQRKGDYDMNQTAFFRFGTAVRATVPATLDTEILSDFWNGFCAHVGFLETELGEDLKISVGRATFLPLDATDDYTLCIRPEGIGILGRDTAGLVRGFAALLLQIRAVGEQTGEFAVPVSEIHGAFSVSVRMLHLCVFPETSLHMLRKLVRLSGVLSYTHVIIEFWGMLRYDCNPALSWENAYTKEEIRPILREARALGVEPVPMFNHLGHAAGCRIDIGKHVVLDQDPAQSHLFTPDGWCWNIFSNAAKKLLHDIRAELCELFGDGSYFHIGCDEAHIYSSEYYPLSGLADFLGELTADVIAEGRRPILWGDMIVPLDLNSDKEEKRAAAKKTEEKMRPLLSALHPRSVIADWHYDITTSPIPTSLIFKAAGFDVIGCPWDKPRNIDAHRATHREHGTFGLMMTTWHTLPSGISSTLYFARKCGLAATDWSAHAGHRNLEIATVLRKLTPAPAPYREHGFCPRQIKDIIDW